MPPWKVTGGSACWNQANAAYEALATDAAGWDSYRREVDSLDATVADGMEKLKV